MSGAYTARAEQDLNYSLVVTMAASFLAGDSLPIVGSFRLNDTAKTIEPPDPTITWTATIDAGAANIRIAGVGSYESSVTSEAADSGSYWQSSVSLEFEDIGAATDRTLAVTGSATMEAVAVSDIGTATVPDYLLNVTSSLGTMLFSASPTCTASFRADSTDKTAEPSNKTITWSSTIDAVAVDLRIGSSGGYTASVGDTVTDGGSYWEVASSLEFDLSRTFGDRTLVITGAGIIDGLAVNDTATVTVEGWYDLEYSLFVDYSILTYAGTGGKNYRARTSIELWVIDLPSTEDWYKGTEYLFLNDGTYDIDVVAERGVDPGNVEVVTSHTREPTSGTQTITVKVGAQVANKKYRIKTHIWLGTALNRWQVIPYVATTRDSVGDVAQTATNTSIVTNLVGTVDINVTGESFTVTETGTMWP